MNTVAVLLKFPSPGKVKTRIAVKTGDERAAQIYSAMAKTVLQTVGAKHRVCVFYDPPDMEREISEWLGNAAEKLLPQRGNILGDRISNAVGDCIALGSRKVAVIGTDCIEITAEDISESFELLNVNDVVIGPCKDGGYYLIALKNNHSAIFSGIEWSTGKVTAQTFEKIRELRLKAAALRTLCDIDRAEDVSEEVVKQLKFAM